MRASEEFNCLEVWVECDGFRLNELNPSFQASQRKQSPTYKSFLEIGDPSCSRYTFHVKNNSLSGWVGDLMTDIQIDQFTLCTDFLYPIEGSHVAHGQVYREKSEEIDELENIQAQIINDEDEGRIVLLFTPAMSLGKIVFSIWRGTVNRQAKQIKKRLPSWITDDMATSAHDGCDIRIPPQDQKLFETFDEDDVDPWIKFVFIYGTHDALILNRVILATTGNPASTLNTAPTSQADILVPDSAPPSPQLPSINEMAPLQTKSAGVIPQVNMTLDQIPEIGSLGNKQGPDPEYVKDTFHIENGKDSRSKDCTDPSNNDRASRTITSLLSQKPCVDPPSIPQASLVNLSFTDRREDPSIEKHAEQDGCFPLNMEQILSALEEQTEFPLAEPVNSQERSLYQAAAAMDNPQLTIHLNVLGQNLFPITTITDPGNADTDVKKRKIYQNADALMGPLIRKPRPLPIVESYDYAYNPSPTQSRDTKLRSADYAEIEVDEASLQRIFGSPFEPLDPNRYQRRDQREDMSLYMRREKERDKSRQEEKEREKSAAERESRKRMQGRERPLREGEKLTWVARTDRTGTVQRVVPQQRISRIPDVKARSRKEVKVRRRNKGEDNEGRAIREDRNGRFVRGFEKNEGKSEDLAIDMTLID
ncbi:uncharacterized protein IL334_002624 [Kwoniella shivajii]|uniref:Uncharacterized protein n=1 Tax=Kwoniella shivajii TaxID=564305 RepID=A0ABZ1CV92_9TREE|nr:hypothetical protein IL334_002624 [Kwoniella shivajii]